MTCAVSTICACRCVRRCSTLCCCCSAVAISTRINLRLLSLFATSIVWQGCIMGIVVLSLLNLNALLAIRRRALLLCWYVTLRCCWSNCGAALMLRRATAGAACATRRSLRLLLLLLLCLLLCLPCMLLRLSASPPARHLLIVLV